MTPGFWWLGLQQKAGCSALLWKRSIQITDCQGEAMEVLSTVEGLLWSFLCLSADQ